MFQSIEIVDNSKVKCKLVRPELASFACEMEDVLITNDHKEGWDNMEVNLIVQRIHGEIAELQEYLTLYNHIQGDSENIQGDNEKVRNMRLEQMHAEALDIANYCMFLCHNYPIKGEL